MITKPALPVWTFWTFHTAKCRAHLEDPGAACICRPPAVIEPLTTKAKTP